ncbi:acetylxylan esterase [Luteolibacter yonseiensis]|uniref:Acetylxylan esterase n=1 Tax=Luteolibacter yonseiensis TaxID=1144680 RepID=A0A934R186_9BACT|nr:acetylxylan esterase [Luteolibacter yonseiensis]MBK1815051.1 acetylxylan esterase [Luteolibacter yonseiensis]
MFRFIPLHFLLSLHVFGAGLPDPLVMADGTPVTTAALWREKRRPELLEFFTREMYGRSPGKPEKFFSEVFDRDEKALGGKATRIQIAIYPAGKPAPRMDLLVYVPNGARQPVPAILGLNFSGNHAIHPDPGIRLTESWVDEKSSKDHRATDANRGSNASQWPVETILSRGYALATMYREDVCPDHPPYFEGGVQPLFPELQKGDDNFGNIGAWAWALSRSLDVLEKEPLLDSKRVAVFGFSRLGKAALWAGATDDRFAMVISNESGAGGAKLFHRGLGEDIARLNTNFPHWFAKSFRQYMGKDTELPFDQHQVISLIAPRPVYVASAEDDKHSDPEGEFASLQAADPVFELLGSSGLPAGKWPAVNTSTQGGNGYHVRTGRHDVTDFDWRQYLDFADKRLKKGD